MSAIPATTRPPTAPSPHPAPELGEAEAAERLASLAAAARATLPALAEAPAQQRRQGLAQMAAALEAAAPAVLAANAQDLDRAQIAGLAAAMIDRLTLTPARLQAMADGLRAIAAQPDPLGRTLAAWTAPSGLRIRRVAVPLGLIAVIYEARPNVTADAAGLCLYSGNAVLLRGGSDSAASSRAIVAALRAGLAQAGLPADALQMPDRQDRALVGAILRAHGVVDVVVPRGGRSLVERVLSDARVPVFAHLDGNCHTYLHAAADPQLALALTLNAKMRRTGICGATETLLIDAAIAPTLLPPIADALQAAGCALRGDERARTIVPAMTAATEADWTTEYLDAILAVRVVDGPDAAIAHINRYGSHHTDSIVTRDGAVAARFQSRVDSAIVMVNTSTQFADGGQFGFGAEIGIATGRLHARGPVGAEQLTTFKYLVDSDGLARP